MTFAIKPKSHRFKAGDLVGQRIILGYAFSIGKCARGFRIWAFVVECSCGDIGTVTAAELSRGKRTSCLLCSYKRIGDKSRGRKSANKTHGESGSKLYSVWQQMIARCSDPNHKQYKDYGGRGITVCEEWLDVKAFCSWARDNGYQEGLEIHREENDFGYSPTNCVWISGLEHRKIKHIRNPLRIQTVLEKQGDIKNEKRVSSEVLKNDVELLRTWVTRANTELDPRSISRGGHCSYSRK